MSRQNSINLDQKIIARDKDYDKSYYRLFKSYLKLGKKDHAVYFGNCLLGFELLKLNNLYYTLKNQSSLSLFFSKSTLILDFEVLLKLNPFSLAFKSAFS